MKKKRPTAAVEEMENLILNLNPKAGLPRGFMFWHEAMQLTWLRQHQLPSKRERGKKTL